jgi:hypothetical protein
MVESNHPFVIALQNKQKVRFSYEKEDGSLSIRVVEPQALYTKNDDSTDYFDAYQVSKTSVTSDEIFENSKGWKTFMGVVGVCRGD